MTLSGRCAAFCASLLVLVGSSPVYAQASVPFDVTAPSIPSTAVIDSYVDGQVKEMASGDRDKVVAARQALLLPNTPSNKSAAFLSAYSKAVGTRLMTVARGDDAHAKLNAGMVAGRIAEMSGSTDLVPLVVELIGDESMPVSLYGVRAASSLVPRVLGDNTLAANDKLVPAIAKALQTHGDSEALVSEAYQSLIRVINSPDQAKALPPNTVMTATPRIVDGLIQLLTLRAQAFGTGNLVEPLAESPAIVFLAKQSTWAAMNEPTQKRAVKVMLDILIGAAKELQVEFNNKPPRRARVAAIQKLVKDAVGQALNVIGSFANNPALVAEADKLKPLNTLTPPAQWTMTVNSIVEAYSTAFKIDASTSKPAN